MTDDLQAALIQKERELQLVLALDKVRDNLEDDGDPQTMIQAIVDLLKNSVEADAFAITMLMETSDDIEYNVNQGFDENDAVSLCREASHHVLPLSISNSQWPFAVGMSIHLERDPFPLGGMVLARQSHAFDDGEIALLRLSESQIDSAIVQARMVWKLAQRNRELEAIYQIDRLQDEVEDENLLIGGIAAVLLNFFRADLCVIMLTHDESSKLVTHRTANSMDSTLTDYIIEAMFKYTHEIRIPQMIPTPTELESMVLLAAPFIVNGVRLGAVVIGRRSIFSLGDHRLLYAMTSQIDTALRHSHLYQALVGPNARPDSF
ncbi:MAG: hypothetical protein H7175_19290 [Burkholderiales bacterium]|nr:hypothetical protein [Anaerolineae bacterium]